MPAQGFAQVIDIIGRESASAHDGQVAGEVDEEPKERTAGSAGGEHADVRVDRSAGLDDVRIPLARMSGLASVAHQEAAVEADARLVPDPVTELGGVERVISRNDSLGDSPGDELDILGVGVGLEAGRYRAAAVGVAGADQNVRRHCLGAFLRRVDVEHGGWLSGTSAAPKQPCRMRNTTICSSDCAAPHSIEVAVNPTRQVR